ncbi:MAG TPA: hypothetical protein VFW98_14615 [Gemmatimonadaceae bacterium]|nr:hypothetical protein [Gemmatimonadaceae bacterium]
MRTNRSLWSAIVRPLAAVFVAAFALASCTPDQSAPTAPPAQRPELKVAAAQPGLSHAMAVKERNEARLFAHKGVVGTAVGVTAEGRPTIEVLTASRGVAGIPARVEDVPVEVQVTGRVFALPARGKNGGNDGKGGGNGGGGGHGGKPSGGTKPTSFFTRPVPIGVSTGNAGECEAGTISARVTKGGNVYALSNNHVYALENSAQIGSTILQPGLYDTRCRLDETQDFLGTLMAFNTIDFSGGDNTIDAAIAATTTSELGNATPADGYGEPSSTVTSASVGQLVQKYGRTTGLTKGQVIGVDVTLDVQYSSGIAHFVNQIEIAGTSTAFSKAGDSGSLIVTDNTSANPVGLLFAGSSNGITFANPIGPVLSHFGVSIDGK